MKLRSVLLIITIFFVFHFLCACARFDDISSSITTKVSKPSSSPSTMTTKPTLLPYNGTLNGRICYTDNTPAVECVYIFESGSFESLEPIWTNAQGEYSIDLPTGDYEVHVAIYRDYGLETPDAKVTVYDQRITTVPLIFVPREIKFDINTQSKGKPFTISWKSILAATSYSVSIGTENKPPSLAEYYRTLTTSSTTLEWEGMPIGDYEITIQAFDIRDKLMGIGIHFFGVR
jgi:hypothetical protein